ncbi:DegV family protein [Antribacter sp. KLBMP9083]|uniref:DegV family protein n=1 Tax=Antribacter soli TaxID=2910976 RepID=A0AA41QEB7_9MICO|nr:DegV family protein [Antribacter soli]MCF4121571.1 DegV family protein [Antribacter soli]
MRAIRRSRPEVRPVVRVVTDSTACLPTGGSGGSGTGVGQPVVVPLRVLVGDRSYEEGVDITPDEVAALVAGGERVTTSQPPPEAFAAVYRMLADDGARAVVSLHLSGELSGTVGSAATAAARTPLAVRVVDSRTAAIGLGFAARAAVECAAAGCDAAHVAARALEVAGTVRAMFVVDSLDHLRRGGRLSGTAAAIGTVLGVRPVLGLRDGRIELLQRVRTRAAVAERLLEEAAADVAAAVRPVVAVQHFGAPDRAQVLAGRLRTRTRADVEVAPLSAVLGVHVGPGTLAVVTADLGDHAH